MIGYAIALVFVLALTGVMAWGMYEVLTMPPDDERWEIIAESVDDRPDCEDDDWL